MMLRATEHPVTTDVDISSKAFWSQSFTERDRSFARLRREEPVSWHPPVEVDFPHPTEAGFWAVSRAEHITAVSHDSERFASRHGVYLDPYPDGATSQDAPFFVVMDGAEHKAYRGLVSAAFTPRAVRGITERIEANAARFVDDIVGAGDIDFVRDLAAKLPMTTVSDLLGIPGSLQGQVAHAADVLAGVGSQTMPAAEFAALASSRLQFLHDVARDMAAFRRAHPADDIFTTMVQGEVDGRKLTDQQMGNFLVLLAIAGNDTTKQTTVSTALALSARPDQRDWLMQDFDGRIMTSIEEMVRYASPIIQFARTALVDTELGGMRIAAGDKVVMFYCSGNRDETVFADPHVFDLTRGRTPHVGFGGGGAHFCLGNGVAKAQLRAIFRNLLVKVPDISFGEPTYLRSDHFNGYTSLPAHVA